MMIEAESVRHDVPGRRSPCGECPPPGEHIEHAENAAGLGPEHLLPDVGVDTTAAECRCRADKRAAPQCKPDALLQFVGLGKAPKLRFAASCSAAETMSWLSLAAPCADAPEGQFGRRRTLFWCSASISPLFNRADRPRAAGDDADVTTASPSSALAGFRISPCRRPSRPPRSRTSKRHAPRC